MSPPSSRRDRAPRPPASPSVRRARHRRPSRPRHRASTFSFLGRRFASSKVPDVDATFWGLKLLSTAMGEATSDFLVHRFSPVAAVLCGGGVFALTLLWQVRTPTIRVVPYWSAVVMVSVFGTMCADVVHIKFAVPYLVSTFFFGATLTGVFFWWWRSEHSLSIHTITSLRRELFYWTTVTVTFALGTALGDFSAYTLGWGFFFSGVIFAVLITLPGMAYRFAHRNAIGTFWAAYVLTRPLGASFADWLGVSPQRGGLNWGPGTVGLLLSGAIVVGVAWRARREKTSTSVVWTDARR